MFRTTIALCLATACTLITGCFPTEPQWLPDSSGLVYPKAGEASTKLEHLDLDRKRLHHIADVGSSSTSPVGISPTGDRFAVIRRASEGALRKGQVVVVDITGRIVHESRPFVLDSETAQHNWDMVSWSPVGNRLLLWMSPPRLYDIDSGTMEVVDGCSPSAIFFVYRVSPFLPDGSGVLLEKGDPEGEPNLVIRTWDGQQHPLKFTKAGEKFQGVSTGQRGNWWPPPGHWRGNVVRLAFVDGYVEIDTQRQQIDFDPSETVARLWKSSEKDNWVSVAAFRDPLRRVVARKHPKTEGRFIVEFFSHPDSEPVVLLPQVRSGYTQQELIPVYPSPSGERIALKYRSEKSDAIRLLVVDAQGKILHDAEL